MPVKIEVGAQGEDKIEIEPPKPLEQLKAAPVEFAQWMLDAFVARGVRDLYPIIHKLEKALLEQIRDEAAKKLSWEVQAAGVPMPDGHIMIKWRQSGWDVLLRLAFVDKLPEGRWLYFDGR